MAPAELDELIRHKVYSALAARGRAPSASRLGVVLGIEVDVGREALERLHAAHALVLDTATREVRMALPFSNVATAYRVESAGRTWDANCAWDTIGIVRLLGLRDARVVDDGGPGREGRELTIVDGELVERDGVISIARPAWRWWDDIVST